MEAKVKKRVKSSSPIEMESYRVKFKIFEKYNRLTLDEKEKVAKIDTQIYSFGESSDSPRDFRFKRTRKTNSRTL